MTMLKFTTRGTPYARGRQQGRICRDLALPWFYKTITELKNKNSSEVIIATVNAARNQLAAVFPAGHEECCGIAAGLEMKEMDYFTAVSCFHLTAALNNCTAAGYFTEDGRPVFIKTDDIYQSELGMNVLETTIPDQGYRHLQFHFAGSIWTVAGMNECGLAMGMTGIPGPVMKTNGLFSLEALHTMLPNCATVAEARAWIEELPLNLYGFSLTLADRAGELAQIEKTGAGTVNLDLPECGFFLHGNTIVDPVFAALNPQQRLPLKINSDRRMKNAARLLRQRPRTEDTLLQLINDRGSEGAVCQTGEEGLFTDFAILCSPAEGRLHYRAGGPDYNDIGTFISTQIYSDNSC